ncbi:hypothetical protein [Haloarchaeobius iranensis]|uniref:Uncharacterized protein n=1 Tax=Haloarchaeobius iranensis TaxID=996166 RepID=A0A1G9W6M8_9EURY|nr:hypothetical protein [Haloarchaeobius iranensis]SDM79715.1 hypothetical protein SAMN05192554_107164 [Haloarchaeobius iranensis]
MVVSTAGDPGYGVLLTGMALVALVLATRTAMLLVQRRGFGDARPWLSAGVAVCEANALLLVVLTGYLLASDRPVPGPLLFAGAGVMLAALGSYRWVVTHTADVRGNR